MAKVLKCEANFSTPCWCEIDIGSYGDLFFSFDIYIPTAVLALNDPGIGVGSGNLAYFLMLNNVFDSEKQGYLVDFIGHTGSDANWKWDWDVGGGGSVGAIVGNQWYHVRIHFVHEPSSIAHDHMFCIDDDVLDTNRFNTSNDNVQHIQLGMLGPDYSGSVSNNYWYIDNFRIGTQGWDSSDIFNENFESGSLAAFTSTSGGVSVITDPTGGVPSPPSLAKIIECDATSDDAFVTYNYMDHMADHFFSEMKFWIPTLTLTHNDSFNWLGDLMDLYGGSFGGGSTVEQSIWVDQEDTINWDLWWSNGNGAGALTPLDADMWHTLIWEQENSTGEYSVYLDGVKYGPYTDDSHVALGDPYEIHQIRFGIQGENVTSPDTTIVYIKDIKIGTTLHGTDIFEDELQTWNTFRGFTDKYGAVSVIDDSLSGPTDYTDAATAILKFTPSGDEGIDDGKLIPFAFVPSGVDAAMFVEASTERVALIPITTFEHQSIIFVDSGTKRLAFSIDTHECYAHATPEYVLDVFKKWFMVVDKQWEVISLNKRWNVNVLVGALEIPC